MRVFYRSSRPGRVVVYEQVGAARFCCREMRDEWGVLIGFGVKGHARTTSREVNIFTSHHAQASGSRVQGITEVRHCPWCGEEIEVVCVK
jgi:hypothetical protein